MEHVVMQQENIAGFILELESDSKRLILGINAGEFSARGGIITIQTQETLHRVSDLEFKQTAGNRFQAEIDDCLITVRTDRDRALRLMVKNISRHPLRIKEITLCFNSSAFISKRIAREHLQLVHSMNFEGRTGIKPMHVPAGWSDVNPESGMVTVFSNITSRLALLTGTLPPYGSCYSYFSAAHDSLHMDDDFGIKIRFEFEQTLRGGQTLKTSPLIALGNAAGDQLLDQYAALLRRLTNLKDKPAVTGWNSWDYYAGAVQRRDMDENTAACRNIFGDSIRYIIIDEGYERQWGVWDAGWKFTEGLKDFCRHVKTMGYKPGIWSAPLMVNVYTPLYREHPDWFLEDKDGNVFLSDTGYGQMAQLDVTHPAARKHLKNVYIQLRSYGFEYFKVDFTQMALKAARFHDSTVGRADIIRTLFQTIRDCIGNDCYLLACGAPFESVTGIADSHRVADDVHNYWGNIIQNTRTIFSRLWMQGSIGNIDPDFLIVRSKATTADTQLNRRLIIKPYGNDTVHWWDGKEMNLDEVRFLALAVYLAGGDIIMGDALEKLNQTGIKILKQVITPLKAPARPLDMFDPGQDCASVLAARTDTGWLAGVFNFNEYPLEKKIELPFHGMAKDATDFWSGEQLRVDKSFILKLRPRSARGIIITETKSEDMT